MIGERLYWLWTQWAPPGGDFTQRDFVSLVKIDGLSESSLTRARTKPNYQFRASRLNLLASTLLVSKGWLLGTNDGIWSDEMLGVRRRLHEWAKANPDLRFGTPGHRLVAAWEETQKILPAIREDIFAAYLRCAVMEKVHPNGKEFVSHLDLWFDIKQHHAEPSDWNLAGAEFLTGLPATWFISGELNATPNIASIDMERLKAFLESHRLSVDDAMSIMSKHTQR